MNLNFDEGIKEFEINGDPKRVIRFNPNDLAFAERYEKAKEKAQELVKKYERKTKEAEVLSKKNPNKDFTVELLKESNKDARELINSIFNDNVADTIFGRVHPFSIVNDSYVILNFMNALNQLVTSSMESSLSEVEQKKINKYKEAYDSLPS